MPSTPSITCRDVRTRAVKALREAGCPDPEGDATALIASILAVDPVELPAHYSDPVDRAKAALVREYVGRRQQREPLAYIIGWCRFRRLRLTVDPRVLVPNDGGATLAGLALPLPGGARVHDVGTGSGAIALGIKDERPDLVVSGSDISAAAIEVARGNAARLGLDVQFTVARGLPPGRYDLVVANLPYLEEGQQDVTDDQGRPIPIDPEYTVHMPHVAVFSGPDGLGITRSFLRDTPSGTRVALEHSPAHSNEVRSFFSDPDTFTDSNPDKRFTIGHLR